MIMMFYSQKSLPPNISAGSVLPKLDKDFNYVLIILAIIFQVPNHRSFGIPSVVKRTW